MAPSEGFRMKRVVSFVLRLAVASAAACSSSTYEGAPAEDAGQITSPDAGGGDDDGGRTSADGSGFVDSGNPRATACTAPPFVGFRAKVRALSAAGVGQP